MYVFRFRSIYRITAKCYRRYSANRPAVIKRSACVLCIILPFLFVVVAVVGFAFFSFFCSFFYRFWLWMEIDCRTCISSPQQYNGGAKRLKWKFWILFLFCIDANCDRRILLSATKWDTIVEIYSLFFFRLCALLLLWYQSSLKIIRHDDSLLFVMRLKWWKFCLFFFHSFWLSSFSARQLNDEEIRYMCGEDDYMLKVMWGQTSPMYKDCRQRQNASNNERRIRNNIQIHVYWDRRTIKVMKINRTNRMQCKSVITSVCFGYIIWYQFT